ncbi:FeoA family protein [Kamptonema formosum]|uniref:FeoA family protein n=1 Tax=Kamptonema formosum TaxID=331992 RepID=UPI00034AFC9E|nr:FeoA family protein [Oscillatoria sp. PCC 10802]
MFAKGFTVAGASLDLLEIGERGTVTHFINPDSATFAQLREMGITPGLPVTLEQRSPCFVIKAGETLLPLAKEMARSIYVRIAK